MSVATNAKPAWERFVPSGARELEREGMIPGVPTQAEMVEVLEDAERSRIETVVQGTTASDIVYAAPPAEYVGRLPPCAPQACTWTFTHMVKP